jgi:3-hydroxyisobutyrate dehydrogenase
MNVTVLGTGTMGAGMARSLLRAGHEVTVWNRSHEKTEPLVRDGATAQPSPADAASSAGVVVTMLPDGDTTAVVMADALDAMVPGTVWAQMATVGVEATHRLAAMAAGAGVTMFDAPVSGTKQPAENGELVVLASGPLAGRDAVEPVFDAVGKRTVWAGTELGAGSALKLVVNDWLVGVLVALGETIAVAEALDVDPTLFLDVIDGGPLGLPYANAKGKAMLERDYPTSFAVKHAMKDARLVHDAAARAGVDARVAAVAVDLFERTSARGHADDDMAAVFEAQRAPAGAR